MLTGNFYFTQRASGQGAKEETKINAKPVLVSGKVTVDYGSIKIDTEIGGDLYLDGKKLGYLQTNSTGNQLNKIKTGTHSVKIVGSETLTREITVYKDSVTTFNFEKAVGASFTDSRDSKTYKSVLIGNQVWMAENLDYSRPGSHVNKNGDRLYTWDAAMKACPAGWHLPSDKEWDILVNRFGGAAKAGAALKSKTGWDSDGNGTNSSGFTGLPAGYRDLDGAFSSVGGYGIFWSSTEGGGSSAWKRRLSYYYSGVYRDYDGKVNAFSCRCVQD